MVKLVLRMLAIPAVVLLAAPLHAAKLPYEDGYKHLGVATCAGSACHGSSRPFMDAPVMQNEYFLWSRDDRHSRAYQTLKNEESARIGRNLGIDPTTSERCLVCHTDYVPEAMRGKRFRLSDGVGCEACHGGAENWLGPHVSGENSHADNLAAGLYPSESPRERGRLCLSCHLGSDDHPIDHEIMGAGHPPLGFELDTFTAIQPAHYTVDADYRERKGNFPAVSTWATGQAVAVVETLEGLASARFKSQGMVPELVFFDCHACHHPMNDDRWVQGTAADAPPGSLRLPDAPYRMLGHVLRQIDGALATAWNDALVGLHRASRQDVAAVKEQAREFRGLADRVLDRVAAHDFSAAQVRGLMREVSAAAAARYAGDFTAAEQATMALEGFIVTLEQRGEIPPERAEKLREPLGSAYDLTAAERQYDAVRFAEAMQRFSRLAPE